MTETKIRALAAAGIVAAAVAVTGCSSSTNNHDMGSMPSPMMSSPMRSGSTTPGASSSEPSAAGAPAAGPHNNADVMFASMMIPHHQQAIEMADMILAKQDVNAKVTDVATRIKAEQTPEIAQMSGWLSGWGQNPNPSPSMGMGGMNRDMGGGTMSQTDMDALHRAGGDHAARLFLTGMVKHHQGAITMARIELSHGQNPDAKTLAQNITTTQKAEIAEMNRLLGR